MANFIPPGDGTSLESYFKAIKTGLQLVSIPVEQVPLLRGLGWVQSPFGAIHWEFSDVTMVGPFCFIYTYRDYICEHKSVLACLNHLNTEPFKYML